MRDNRTEDAYRYIKVNSVRSITSHPSYDMLYLNPVVVLVYCLVAHCMVVYLTGIHYSHVLAVQRRSLIVVRQYVIIEY